MAAKCIFVSKNYFISLMFVPIDHKSRYQLDDKQFSYSTMTNSIDENLLY